MTHILVITSNHPRDAFRAARLADHAVDELRARFPEADVVVRDLAQSVLPRAGGFYPEDPVLGGRKPGTSREATMADDPIDELLAADILVIAVPMLDYSLPPALKAWVDHVTRRGRTFRYTEGLPKGLVTGKKAVIVRHKSSQAGTQRGLDYQAPYLRQMLGFLGMTDIEVMDVASGGQASGETASQRGVVWSRDAGAAALGVHIPATVTRSTHDVASSPRHAGAERRPPSPSPEWTSLGAPAAKSARLKAPWR